MMNTIVLAGAAVFKGDKILLLKRLETKRFLPGYYDIPGGKLEDGEDPNDAVLRELKEETGLGGRIIRPYNVWHTLVERDGHNEHVIEIDYLVDADTSNEIVLSPTEFSEYMWVDKGWVDEAQLPKERITPELKGTLLKAFMCRREK